MLRFSLYEEQHHEALQRISTRSLVELFKFHRKRWDKFWEGVAWDAGYRERGNSVDGSVVDRPGVADVFGYGREDVGR